MKRTDVHRKGAIIPAEYEHVIFYNLPTVYDGWPIPSFGVNCELDHRKILADGTVVNGKHHPSGQCCVVGLRHVAKVKWAKHGGTGQCTACGTRFVYGEVWRHTPTDEYIHVGHICADKYGLLADRSAFELEAGRRRDAEAARLQRKANEAERERFLELHPGLEKALETDHYIINDIKGFFKRFRQLSDKQIALVFKIVNEIENPPPEEKKVKAPTGRQTFTGIIVKSKAVDNGYGLQFKGLIKVKNCNGIWLAWGTIPAAILDEVTRLETSIANTEVEITATLKPGSDEHFVFMSRPRGRIITPSKEAN